MSWPYSHDEDLRSGSMVNKPTHGRACCPDLQFLPRAHLPFPGCPPAFARGHGRGTQPASILPVQRPRLGSPGRACKRRTGYNEGIRNEEAHLRERSWRGLHCVGNRRDHQPLTHWLDPKIKRKRLHGLSFFSRRRPRLTLPRRRRIILLPIRRNRFPYKVKGPR